MNEKMNQILEGIDIRFQEPLKYYTFTKVGGNAEFLAFPRNQYELKRIVKFANQEQIPWMVLGNASNIIVRDGGIPGFVIMFDRLRDISVDGYGEKLEVVVEDHMKSLKHLLSTCDDGRMIKEGIKTVIVGKPNAGKSSLLNVLLGEERAIVTEIAGTTRDVLEEHMNLQGISLNIVDTAGIRDTEDVVEKIGVDRAKENAKDADLIMYVIDASAPLDENDDDIMRMIYGRKAIILLNKADLNTILGKDEIKKKYSEINQLESYDIFPAIIEISAKNGQGIGELEQTLKEMFFEGKISFNDEIYITNVRHKTALNNAYEALKKVKESIDMGMPEDFYSIDLMDAYEELGSITGETIGEDLVNEIFSKFCMGK